MKKNLLVLFLLITSVLQAQSEYPLLNAFGRTMESLVPNDWVLISNASGDLNNDKIDDIAFVIEKTEPLLNENDSLVGTKVLRILGIYLTQKKSDGYFKNTQSNTFIISKEINEMMEPFQGLYISNEGFLEINFQIWKDETKWLVTTHSYRFEYQNNAFELVLYNSNETNRNTGDSVDYSVDFNEGKIQTVKSNYLNGNSPRIEYKSFKLGYFQTLNTLSIPLNWQLEGIKI